MNLKHINYIIAWYYKLCPTKILRNPKTDQNPNTQAMVS